MGGYGRGWNRNQWPETATPSGYAYVGPCRCGAGPHAFYQDRHGRAIHARSLYRGRIPSAPTAEDLKAELKVLTNEKQELEKHIEELEKKDGLRSGNNAD